jgi:peptide/nickel transport system permease protein
MEQLVPSGTDGPQEIKRTRFQILLSKLTHNWMGTIGLVMFVIVLVVAVFASKISPYDPYAVINATTIDVMGSPSAAHPLGQDESGKDVLSEVFYGARVSLLIGITASLIVVVLGGFLGTVAGYFSGSVDTVIMRIVDAILVVPQLPLMLVIIAVAGRGLVNIVLVIGFLSWTYMARIVRSQVLSIRERPFILRARAIGVGHTRIMFRHILPQVLPIILAQATLDVSWAILTEATLSFLGLGDPTLISWGGMLNRAFLQGALMQGAWWFLFPPGLALAWVTISLTFLGNGLQEIVNPRLRTHNLYNDRKMVSIKQ